MGANSLIFGFDIGTTSIGWAVVAQSDQSQETSLLDAGVRIFPETREPQRGAPLNQTRRQKRLMRRQVRRRRERRRALGSTLEEVGLLPRYNSTEWNIIMGNAPGVKPSDPYVLRARAADVSEELTPFEVGRALYHLAKRRHFRGRDLAEDAAATGDESAVSTVDPNASNSSSSMEDDGTEAAAGGDRESVLGAVKSSNLTLGAWLLERSERTGSKRGIHAHRNLVLEEFEAIWNAQSRHHPELMNDLSKRRVAAAIFFQRPVFWRLKTLGQCPLVPGASLCPRGSWLSYQRRLLEKLNLLEIAGGNARPLDTEERDAIRAQLERQNSMSWAGVRRALAPIFEARGDKGGQKKLVFNLERGGEKDLKGNPIEAQLALILGPGAPEGDWSKHPMRDRLRAELHELLFAADYRRVGSEGAASGRVEILRPDQQKENRKRLISKLVDDFEVTEEQATALATMVLPGGWEPYSTDAIQALLPKLEEGHRFGALLVSPDFEEWRETTFPDRERPTGEVMDRLPTPANPEEATWLGRVRNPTVVRVLNELRKVVNNLIGEYGKPDRIRVEVARDVGRSQRERSEYSSRIRKREAQRRAARDDLIKNGFAEPSRADIEKWLLWKESQERCPYTGDAISFDALFQRGEFEVEHIWPRARVLDDSFANKTLCRKDVNLAKGTRTPFEFFSANPEAFEGLKDRLDRLAAPKPGAPGIPRGKVRRFLAETIPDDFQARQLNDTGYAARMAVASLKRLWPDLGPSSPVNVSAVSGQITSHLRRLWGLNGILSEDGQKTRDDHRHHAIDAVTVALTDHSSTQRLSRYWKLKDDPEAVAPEFPPAWPTIRRDVERLVGNIIVSHRVRRKISGPLHKETVFGDTGIDERTKRGTYRLIVTRKALSGVQPITKGEIARIRDPEVKAIVEDHVASHGGDPKKAFPPFPRLKKEGPEIRRVRIIDKQQMALMSKVSTGLVDTSKSNNHIAIYQTLDDKIDFEVVSLFEAARRLAAREPIVRRDREDGSRFLFSLGPGNMVHIPSGDRSGYWVIVGVWANGQIVLQSHADATVKATVQQPRPGPLIRNGMRKVAVDPIGRVRPARD